MNHQSAHLIAARNISPENIANWSHVSGVDLVLFVGEQPNLLAIVSLLSDRFRAWNTIHGCFVNQDTLIDSMCLTSDREFYSFDLREIFVLRRYFFRLVALRRNLIEFDLDERFAKLAVDWIFSQCLLNEIAL